MSARGVGVSVIAALALLAGSCGGVGVSPDRGPRASAWDYELVFDEGLTRLTATVCFEGEMAWELVPIDGSGRRYLRSATGSPAGAAAAPVELPRVGRAVSTRGLPPDSCVRYVVDLEAAARQRGGLHGAYRIGDDLVASTAVWLWAPREREPDARVTARFVLPEGIGTSPLWTLLPDDRRRLDERAFRFTAYAAFGRFETHHIGVPGGCIRLSVLGDGVDMGDQALARCFAGSANAASMMFGRFPIPEVGVLAVPTPFSTSSPFGLVGRGTMPTVAILVGQRATEEGLAGAWVPVHEFSHLAVPFIDREDAWLSEGIATYYQEVLRARGGLQSAEVAWRHLDDGFSRGAAAGTGRSLGAESRDMAETAESLRVYWGGAAIALIADVTMRARSDGRRSLDDALEHLSDCCGGRTDPMTGDDAIVELDTVEPRVFGGIARRWLDSREFPDLRETYARLGLRRDPTAGLVLDEAAEARALRDAIMTAHTSLEPIPSCVPR